MLRNILEKSKGVLNNTKDVLVETGAKLQNAYQTMREPTIADSLKSDNASCELEDAQPADYEMESISIEISDVGSIIQQRQQPISEANIGQQSIEQNGEETPPSQNNPENHEKSSTPSNEFSELNEEAEEEQITNNKRATTRITKTINQRFNCNLQPEC